VGLRSITAINAALNTANPATQGQIALAEGCEQPLDAVLRLITEVADTNPNFALVQGYREASVIVVNSIGKNS